MAEPDHHIREAELPSGTLTQLFLETVDRFGEKEALLAFKGDSNELESLSYSDALRAVQDVVGGLRAAGIDRGDRVAILSNSRPEWALADYGCICAGVVDVPIYPTLLDDQVGHILTDSGAKLVFAENAEQVTKVRNAADPTGLELQIVVFEWQGELPGGVRTWSSFIEEGRAEAERTGAASGGSPRPHQPPCPWSPGPCATVGSAECSRSASCHLPQFVQVEAPSVDQKG